jgi:hypothetical protein
MRRHWLFLKSELKRTLKTQPIADGNFSVHRRQPRIGFQFTDLNPNAYALVNAELGTN